MILKSTHTPKEYKKAMKARMGSRFAIGSERFTGIFIGRFFYITHHAGYEWNRRITCQTNSAWGRIKKSESGSDIHFHKAYGWFCPHMLLLYIVIMAIPCWELITSWEQLPALVNLLMAGIIILMPIIYSAIESTTDASIEGEKSLMGLIKDPADLFAYLNHQKELR